MRLNLKGRTNLFDAFALNPYRCALNIAGLAHIEQLSGFH
jgi:hypothetical protein